MAGISTGPMAGQTVLVTGGTGGMGCKPSTTLGVTHGFGRIFAARDSRACRRAGGVVHAVSGK